jgi:hypothetical protein
LLELSEARGADIRIESPDGTPSIIFLARRETTPPSCRVSLSPEGASFHEDASAPKGAAKDDPVPKGLGTGSPSVVSMDVHVGSLLVRSEEAMAMGSGLPTSPTGSATLEVCGHGTEDMMGALGAKIPLGVTLSMDYNLPLVSNSAPDTASVSVFPFDSILMPPALGFPCSFPTFR